MKPITIFQDAFNARLIVRPHMLDQRKFVLNITPQPLEVSAEELSDIASKLARIALAKVAGEKKDA